MPMAARGKLRISLNRLLRLSLNNHLQVVCICKSLAKSFSVSLRARGTTTVETRKRETLFDWALYWVTFLLLLMA